MKKSSKRVEEGTKGNKRVFCEESRRESLADVSSHKDFWRAEIDGLKDSSFDSMEEAIQAIIDKVLKRLKLVDAGDQKLSAFLHSMIEMDPLLKEKLSRLLKIKT